jgi:hypothetical protein
MRSPAVERQMRKDPRSTIRATATRRRHGITAWSHNADALRLDPIISVHDPRGSLARDHDARGSGQRGALALAKIDWPTPGTTTHRRGAD